MEQIFERAVHNALDNITDQVFQAPEQLVKVDERTLAFNVSISAETSGNDLCDHHIQ